ncbi:autophagy-related protein 27 [Radiomyces spectabilis]|uniref:autophagy-related protein 27 n=1 Tax=Radiomyces spectabilis TaxID=64574 RepID=UPI00221F94F4|nr:autophagy-related protein 27 [Radiomyces spectabilis]KAI8393837.1 autophagy-related protein 27 [Radiomyces spectabilis]
MRHWLSWIISFSGISAVLAIQDYCAKDYQPVAKSDWRLDLSALDTEYDLFHNESTPPTVTSAHVQLNICNELKQPENPNEDDCDKGVYICRRIINIKQGEERVEQVQNIAGAFQNSAMPAQFKTIDTEQDLTKTGTEFSLVLGGGQWNNQAQSAQILLECDESQDRNAQPSKPTIISYQNNVLSIQWKTVFACAYKKEQKSPTDDDKPDDHKDTPDDGRKDKDQQPKPGEDVGTEAGGISWMAIFFMILIIMALTYMAAGAFYNYRTYNARGLDLLPHRDFWLDLPYLIKDLISHMMDSFSTHRRSGGGGGAYVSV